ncbi:IS630 family transposase [Streptomyces sp. H27-H5]|uniref:IS630 family transposase n=2 Tax=unclassified Streptomyces TaxID=2593676 RepID=UPI00226ECA90|nr:IS630 family transposase [Streptomyces sp. H27-H5]MCY0963509.1 IS630 family transposase [Streptomyces sp. H27-H5]
MWGNGQVNSVMRAVPVELAADVRALLEQRAASTKAAVRDAMRARVVLAASDGMSNAEIAHDLSVTINTVRKWRGRYAELGPAGLLDAARSGRPRQYGDLVRIAVVAAATAEVPDGAATWTHVAIAEQVRGTVFAPVSASWAGRVLADLDLKPHKVTGWLTRRDTPDFWERARDICELYRNPPAGAVVLSIDEKTAIAARSRKHPAQPATPAAPGQPGRPARQEFEYVRHGTASLVAAMDVTSGEVLTEVIDRNTAATFTAFLDQLDATIEPGKNIHVVLDNGSSHTARHTKKWLANHPRWHVHWTPPHASWLNQIELVFSALTRRVLRHGDFTSRDDLIAKMDDYMIKRNETARPFKWTYAASPLQEA